MFLVFEYALCLSKVSNLVPKNSCPYLAYFSLNDGRQVRNEAKPGFQSVSYHENWNSLDTVLLSTIDTTLKWLVGCHISSDQNRFNTPRTIDYDINSIRHLTNIITMVTREIHKKFKVSWILLSSK